VVLDNAALDADSCLYLRVPKGQYDNLKFSAILDADDAVTLNPVFSLHIRVFSVTIKREIKNKKNCTVCHRQTFSRVL